jgi:hypothetical protein
MCVTHERRLPVNAATPEASRSFAHAAVVATLRPNAWYVVDDIVLIASELATETVLAGATELVLGIEMHYSHIAVVTHDDRAPGWRERVGDNETRRHLLDALASTRDVIAEADGTTSIACVRCDPRLSETVPCEHRPAG